MKKRIAIALMAAGCLMVPACLNQSLFGFGVSNLGLNVCLPGYLVLNICADLNTPVDFSHEPQD